MNKTKDMIYISICASITVIVSQITIVLPLTPVPMNLGVVGGYIAGMLLGPKKGALSQLIYLLLGAIGLPVFAHFSGGVSILVGPTGGFLFGYIAIAYIVGGLTNKKSTLTRTVIALTLGLLACYLMGLVWIMIVLNIGLIQAFVMSILPFIAADIIKILIVAPILQRLNKQLDLR